MYILALFLTLLCYTCGEIFDRNQSVIIPPKNCPKGIRCLNKKIFIFCDRNNIFVVFGKQIFHCVNNSECDENDPYNGCVPSLFYNNVGREKRGEIHVNINKLLCNNSTSETIVIPSVSKNENVSKDAVPSKVFIPRLLNLPPLNKKPGAVKSAEATKTMQQEPTKWLLLTKILPIFNDTFPQKNSTDFQKFELLETEMESSKPEEKTMESKSSDCNSKHLSKEDDSSNISTLSAQSEEYTTKYDLNISTNLEEENTDKPKPDLNIASNLKIEPKGKPKPDLIISSNLQKEHTEEHTDKPEPPNYSLECILNPGKLNCFEILTETGFTTVTEPSTYETEISTESNLEVEYTGKPKPDLIISSNLEKERTDKPKPSNNNLKCILKAGKLKCFEILTETGFTTVTEPSTYETEISTASNLKGKPKPHLIISSNLEKEHTDKLKPSNNNLKCILKPGKLVCSDTLDETTFTTVTEPSTYKTEISTASNLKQEYSDKPKPSNNNLKCILKPGKLVCSDILNETRSTTVTEPSTYETEISTASNLKQEYTGKPEPSNNSLKCILNPGKLNCFEILTETRFTTVTEPSTYETEISTDSNSKVEYTGKPKPDLIISSNLEKERTDKPKPSNNNLKCILKAGKLVCSDILNETRSTTVTEPSTYETEISTVSNLKEEYSGKPKPSNNSLKCILKPGKLVCSDILNETRSTTATEPSTYEAEISTASNLKQEYTGKPEPSNNSLKCILKSGKLVCSDILDETRSTTVTEPSTYETEISTASSEKSEQDRSKSTPPNCNSHHSSESVESTTEMENYSNYECVDSESETQLPTESEEFTTQLTENTTESEKSSEYESTLSTESQEFFSEIESEELGSEMSTESETFENLTQSSEYEPTESTELSNEYQQYDNNQPQDVDYHPKVIRESGDSKMDENESQLLTESENSTATSNFFENESEISEQSTVSTNNFDNISTSEYSNDSEPLPVSAKLVKSFNNSKSFDNKSDSKRPKIECVMIKPEELEEITESEIYTTTESEISTTESAPNQKHSESVVIDHSHPFVAMFNESVISHITNTTLKYITKNVTNDTDVKKSTIHFKDGPSLLSLLPISKEVGSKFLDYALNLFGLKNDPDVETTTLVETTTTTTIPLHIIHIPGGSAKKGLLPKTIDSEEFISKIFESTSKKAKNRNSIKFLSMYHPKIFVRYMNTIGSNHDEVYNTGVNFQKQSLSQIDVKVDYDEILIAGQKIPIFMREYLGPMKRLTPWKLTIRSSVHEFDQDLFADVEGLTEFEASLNLNLTTINSGVFNGRKIQILKLTDNKISKISSDAFDNMKNLRTVDLSNNKLQIYDREWFKNCSKLNWIYISYNDIKVLPPLMFKNLNPKQPWVIVLNYNYVEEISDKIFARSEEDLNSEDYLKTIHPNTLNLKGNDLECLPENLDAVIVPNFVNLKNNRLRCSCKRKIRAWSKSHPSQRVLMDRGCKKPKT